MATSEKAKLVRLDPHKIKIPSVRVTSVWQEDEYESFKASLAADGMVNPIICVKEGEGYWLADGLHRLEEAKLNGEKQVEVVYREGSMIEAMTRNLYLNRLRGKTKLSEEITVVKELADTYHLSLEDIESKTGMSKEAIEQRQQISKASALVMDAVESEQIGLGTAFQLSRLSNQDSQNAILSQLLLSVPPKSTKFVQDIVDATLQLIKERKEGVPRPEEVIPVKTLKCHICDQRYEPKEVKGINVCETCLGLCKDYVKRKMKEATEQLSPEETLARKAADLAAEGEGGS